MHHLVLNFTAEGNAGQQKEPHTPKAAAPALACARASVEQPWNCFAQRLFPNCTMCHSF